MKVIEHAKRSVVCTHPGSSWNAILPRILSCMGASASDAERKMLIASFDRWKPAWHKGEMLTPGYYA